jgi:hypothetical protein
MSARYSVPILVGLTVTGLSAAYLLYLLFRKVRAVFYSPFWQSVSGRKDRAFVFVRNQNSVLNYSIVI